MTKKKSRTYKVPHDLEELARDITLMLFQEMGIELEPDEAKELAPVLKVAKKKPRKGRKGRSRESK